ncbi:MULTISPECIES: aldo/keto reductase [unclassified Sphingobium]|uniref:aldo/keto reductase n=1 Tax=unclassified Sphingobium TaxID=2611147 RepID=UPI000D15BCE0|nr:MULTISPECIES: aldo/keto reductase [unclassified Sphingobium]MBG6120127.1 aryl-alcohol dehydrogenase-like predicted oxidoreductase [Sphingobium sp. JAI105]PSO12831.1 alcohol dehydrogenase [Sphingobium sp. AEW4]TWD05672.1 aryl-alcohol dehydrogenase-like predicted oxidoreductase [Sphingobium sp. AEW010]TWD23225.1 aryl-alcohol dehydrogenase-like predicted oxidoreductase [Sphingobium sp. AEW013]TWD25085.1 aryl-alcohol dehydrogenase-like predicted oxidoreductase [Sphingobium sp. AEW001]
MEYRRLAPGLPPIAPLIFGGNVFGWTVSEADAFPLLDAFVDLGFSAIDTADIYVRFLGQPHVGGESEAIIGQWIARRGRSDDLVITTKVGMDMGSGATLRRDHILTSIDQSLARLRRDHVDLYLAHWDDPKTPVEEVLETLGGLIDAGKVRAIGCSNYSAERLETALAVARKAGLPCYAVLQTPYNLYARESYEAALEPLCLREGIAVTPYYGLASGFLTGKYRSAADAGKSSRGRGIAKSYLNDRGFAILAALDAVAAGHGATPAQIALAWLIAQPGVVAPLASATSLPQLREIAGAPSIALTPGDIARLDAASAPA